MSLIWKGDFAGLPGKVVLASPMVCANTAKGDNKLYSDAKGVVPSLDLRFASQKNLNDYMTGTPLVDHQRSMSGSNLSPGTFVNSSGLIETAKVNALTANSEVFSGWPIPSTSTQTTTSPFNTTAASIDSATALSISVNDSSAVTFSGYFKQGSSRYVYLRPVVWADNPRVWFDLQTGNFVNVSPAAAPISNAFATSVGNGWYRCGFTLDSTGDSVGNLQITATDSSTNINSVGYVFAFGIQVEEGPVSTYIPTTTSASAAPRFDHNPTTGESLGLLVEETRTNLLAYSENFDTATTSWFNLASGTGQVPVITPNAVVSPDGTTNATQIDFDVTGGSTGGDISLISQSYTANATLYVLSAWIRADTNTDLVFDSNTGTINTVSLTTEWQRISYPKINTSGSRQVRIGLRADRTVSQTATIYIWGAQIEQSSSTTYFNPTSYIPTTGTALTRSADVASISGTNFSSWYNQSEGTIYGIFDSVREGSGRRGWSFGGGGNRHWFYASISQLIGSSGGSTNYAFTFPAITSTAQKAALGYALNNNAGTINGSTIQSDTSCNPPIGLNSVGIGSDGSGIAGTLLGGTISRLTYFPYRIPDANLQAITAP